VEPGDPSGWQRKWLLSRDHWELMEMEYHNFVTYQSHTSPPPSQSIIYNGTGSLIFTHPAPHFHTF
jgi:hypothetical protein